MKKFFKLLWAAIRGDEEEYTSGSIRKAIFLLAVPMVLEMVMESLFALVDVFFVSKISTEAVATVGLTEVVLMLIESIAIGIAMAATAMVSRRVGEDNMQGAKTAAVQTIYLGLMISIPVGIFCWYFAPQILGLMGGSEALVQTGSMYTRIVLGLNFLLFFLFLLNAIFRGAGNAAIAMRVLLLANGLNIILDPCLIFGLGPFPELGLTGAAVATCIGRGIGLSLQLYYLFFSDVGIINLRTIDMAWAGKIIRRLTSVSITGVAQFLIATASWLFIVRIISSFGDQALAGYTIAVRIIIFTILPAWGLSNAAATLVGQNLGAQKPDRAAKTVWLTANYTTIFLIVVSVVFLIWAPFFMSFFSEDPVVRTEGAKGLRIFALGYVSFSYGMVITSAFNGAGDTRTPMLMNIICFWIIQIPLAYFLAHYTGLGVAGPYWAIAISETVLAFLAIYLFRLGKWKEIVI